MNSLPRTIRQVLCSIALGMFALIAHAAWENEQLEAFTKVHLPEGGGKQPLMIIVQGTASIGSREREWAKWFTERSIAAIIIDSAGLRGRRHFDGVNPLYDYSSDIIDVLKWMESNPRIDAKRFGLIGFSRGGTTVLNAGKHFDAQTTAPAFVFSFYPGLSQHCPNTFDKLPTTVHVFYGEVDEYGIDQGLQKACRSMTEKSQNASYHELPGAHHGFDQPGEGSFTAGRKSFRKQFNEAALSEVRRIIENTINNQWATRN